MHGHQGMKALHLLKKHHAKVKQLFKQLVQVKAEDEHRQHLFRTLAVNFFAAHATVDEKIYRLAALAKQTEILLNEAVEDHLVMKRILGDLADLSLSHKETVPRVAILRQQVELHREEEQKLLKGIRKELSQEMKEIFDEKIAGVVVPSHKIPANKLQ